MKNEEGLIGAINFKGELVVDYISKDLPLEFDHNDGAVFYKDSRYFYNVNCSFRFRSRRNKRLKEPG